MSQSAALSSVMTATTLLRAVLYVRLPKESGVSMSILEQNDDLVSVAQREGWDVVEVCKAEARSAPRHKPPPSSGVTATPISSPSTPTTDGAAWASRPLAALIEVVDARARTDRPVTFMAVREGIESTQSDWQLRAAFAAIDEASTAIADAGRNHRRFHAFRR